MRYLDTVSVQLREKVAGSAGQAEWSDAGDPVTVRGNVHPLEADEIVYWGDHGRDMRKLFCKSWPGDIHSVISWDGAAWDQVAPEQLFKIGQSTKHVEVILRRR
jgi:hypothetical protein